MTTTAPASIVDCTASAATGPTLSTQVDFFYNVETDTVSTPADVANTLSENLNQQFAAAIANEHCPARRRRLEIASVMTAPDDIPLGPCEIIEANSQSCTAYQGGITVDYTPTGNNADPPTIQQNARGTIKSEIGKQSTLDNVNAALAGTGVTVTLLTYVDNNGPSLNAAENQIFTTDDDDDGLNPLGIAMVVLVALLLLLILLLLCCCWRRRRRRARGAKGEVLDKSYSMATDASSTIGADNRRFDNALHLTKDFRNLGCRLATVDVHRCSSATCTQCNPALSRPASPPPSNLLNQKNPSPIKRRPLAEETGLVFHSDEDSMPEDEKTDAITRGVQERLGRRVHRRTAIEPPAVRFVRVSQAKSLVEVERALRLEAEEQDEYTNV